jgi:hypothetical protein
VFFFWEGGGGGGLAPGSSLSLYIYIYIYTHEGMELLIIQKEMLVVILTLFCCSHNYNVMFKIINKLKVNNDNFKLNDNLKS